MRRRLGFEMRSYRIGKQQGNSFVPVCKISRKEDGGISLTDVEINSEEQRLLLAHFGRVIRGRTGVANEQHIRSFMPGTQAHFDQAVHLLPAPFGLMRREG